jgi:hypothetical protein
VRRRSSFRLGLAASVTAAMVVSLSAFGGLGYASSSVQHAVNTVVHVVAPAHHAAPRAAFNSAAAQYGGKALVCHVEPNGKQKTQSIAASEVASFLANHPGSYAGACHAQKPGHAKKVGKKGKAGKAGAQGVIKSGTKPRSTG